MSKHTGSIAPVHQRVIVTAMVVALMALGPTRLIAADASPQPPTGPSPTTSITPAQAACDTLDDLGLIVEFLQGTDVSEDGWLPIFVGVLAGLGEARQLADALGETYRPLMDDLVVALEGLRATITGFRVSPTIGSAIADIGEAITDVGNAMDALSTQMRTPCADSAPAASLTPPD